MIDLSQDEVNHFLKEILQIDCNPVVEQGPRKLELLNQVIRRFHETIPFQNLRLLSIPPKSRCLPSVERMKEFLLSGEGGMCGSLNIFMFGLLTALRFEVHPIQSCVGDPTQQDHVIMTVHNLVQDGDCFLVDVGFGFPTFAAVPLDFSKESPMYTESFLTYKFVYKQENDTYIRMHKLKKNVLTFPTVEDRWCHAYYFELKRYNFDTISNQLNIHVYQNKEARLQNCLRVVRWKDGKCIALKKYVLLLEDSNNELEAHYLETEEDHERALEKYFPMLPKDVVREAIQNSVDSN